MTLLQAINTLEAADFKGAEPETLQALAVILQVARVQARALELDDISANRVVETTVD